MEEEASAPQMVQLCWAFGVRCHGLRLRFFGLLGLFLWSLLGLHLWGVYKGLGLKACVFIRSDLSGVYFKIFNFLVTVHRAPEVTVYLGGVVIVGIKLARRRIPDSVLYGFY